MPVFKIIHHSDSLTEGGDPQYIEQGFFGSHPQSLNKASVERSSELAETSTYEVKPAKLQILFIYMEHVQCPGLCCFKCISLKNNYLNKIDIKFVCLLILRDKNNCENLHEHSLMKANFSEDLM